ncbi:helix-turn-helix transcriptional regulator [Janthinobacterium tructae]|nr:AlpA family phage regulatory protein [Janthinobacterium tructae]MDI3292296.1 AlpA family phage regulatory protein [Janthinobacterium tructae]
METKTEQLEDRFLKLREVMAMCRLSRSTIYGAIRKGQFPAQIKLSE